MSDEQPVTLSSSQELREYLDKNHRGHETLTFDDTIAGEHYWVLGSNLVADRVMQRDGNFLRSYGRSYDRKLTNHLILHGARILPVRKPN